MSFVDPRLPGREYKTERGLKSALRALEKRELEVVAQQVETADVPSEHIDTPTEPYAGPIFLRNLRDVPVRLHFGNRKDGRAVNLRPRGQRGDFDRLQPGEEFDQQLNDAGWLFELLTDREIARVIQGQTTNQQAVHPALAHLRTPTGEQYQGEVRMQEEFTQQGIAVGTLVEQGPNRIHQSRTVVQRLPQVDVAVGPQRAALVGTQDRPVPGATVSQSVPAEEQAAYVAERGGLQALIERDAVARLKNIEGPEAGLGGLRPGGVGPAMADVVATRFDDAGIDPTRRTPEAPVTGHEQI